MRKDITINKLIEGGEKRGIQKGRKEWILEGITETAKKLLSNNVSIDIISASTGLSLDEIKSLK